MKNLLLLALFTLPFFFIGCTDSDNGPDKGEAMFWTDQYYQGALDVWIDDAYEGQFDGTFLDITPDCGQTGTLTLSLEPGIHTYRVVRPSYDEWTGSISVASNSCTEELINKKQNINKLIKKAESPTLPFFIELI